VPTEAFRSLDTVADDIARKLPSDIPLHGLLAADLLLKKTSKPTPWNAMFPSMTDFEATMPLMWPEELSILLPKPAKDLREKQRAKFRHEWNIVAKAFPEISQEEYLYFWLVLNTRTFYYVTPEMERFLPEDRLALLPVADLFNHADSGCEVLFSSKSFIIVTNRAYRAGEEVLVCYGQQSNDWLLAEFGFMLTKNRWDEVCLDEVILPNLDVVQKAELENRDYLGNYMLNVETGVCYRTQVVLRLLCCTPREWCAFVDGKDDGEASQRMVDSLLIQILERFQGNIRETLTTLEKVNVGLGTQRELLTRRWKQIESVVVQSIKRLKV